ncbi:hydantoinase/oxoprolinase family protein [Chthonobacter albigriseus]|uniref:hydantoinase/oxoprolinase family protein n=1 Tax=Chthonobacter albigriseus TaxID=1683161 RepID=UPI0015EEAD96|nr:hydantoinase/oxoprolinase family protein [Chthonobacter albigriseus]
MTSHGGAGKATLGWDIGGAHLKAARVVDGRIAAVAQEPCPLWQGLDKLDAAFDALLARLGPADRHAATMTGELVDLFENRADGVARLSTVAARRCPGVRIYAGRDGFVDPAAAAGHADAIASANWHATAAFVGAAVPDALLVDMGSTTTDIIPVRAGRVAARGYTDAERLASGELVYTGATRTALMAIAPAVPVAGTLCGVAAEYFATMADANRILGRLDVGADQHPTADGRGKSVAESRLRLSRMVGRDVADLDEAGWTRVAEAFAEAQVRRVHDAAALALSASPLPADAPVVGCGIGRFAVAELARRLGRPYVDLSALLPVAPAEAARAASCAPAVAVALLAGG